MNSTKLMGTLLRNKRTTGCNSTCTQAGFFCFSEQQIPKFEVQFVAGSSVVKCLPVTAKSWLQYKSKIHKQRNMEKNELYKLTDEELSVLKKKLKKAKVFHAASIGFLAGILIFGFVSWMLSSEKRFGFLIPMSIPVVFIYKLLKKPDENRDLEEVLKERNLN
jgi:hypothetical protein